jgi:nicotinate-nucleotide adenylyltransferase
MRIGFFGGSFDPPHLGHLAVGRAAADAFLLDRILFAPTAHQPLKPGGATVSFQDRLAMVSLLCELQSADTAPRFEPSSLDAPLPGCEPNYTVDTLTRLRDTIPSAASIFVIVGADSFIDLRHWRSPGRLLTLAEWIVVSRPGFSLHQLDALALAPQQLQRIHLLEGVHEPASATSVRTLLRAGSDCPGLLPASVLHYIRACHLYGT